MRNFLNKWRLSIQKKMYPDDILTEKQQIGLDIFITGLNDDNLIRFLNADDNKDIKYMVSKDYYLNGGDDVETFITFFTKSLDGDSQLTVVNHNFSYDFDFPQSTTSQMNKLFKEAVKRDRYKMENTVNKQTTNSLTQILRELREKQKANARPLDESEFIK